MIKGVLVPNITIFDKEGNVDIEKTKWHMSWMFEKGVDGLFLTGSYGAGPLMTKEERIDIFKAAKEVVKNFSGKTLIAHVGCADSKSTVELAKAAEKIGVDAIGAVPPFYYKYEEEQIIEYYKDIIDNVKLPVYAYNNPSTTRFTFTVKTVNKLEALGLAGVKDSPCNVGFLSSIYYEKKNQKKDFQLIIGTSSGWLPFYYMGIKSMIAGMCNYAPEIVVDLYKYTLNNETEKAEKAYSLMMDLSKKMHFTDSTIASHIGITVRGFDAGYARRPMIVPPLEDPIYDKVKGYIEDSLKQLAEI
jgi:dihydrodipicolinate synthase/N-acetylneuraminate lyase